MIKIHDVEPFLVHEDALLIKVFDKLGNNDGDTIFVVDKHMRLIGSITDGDIRRFISHNQKVDMSSISAMSVKNSSPFFLHDGFHTSLPPNRRLNQIPVVDDDHKLKFIMTRTAPIFNLGKYKITSRSRVLTIAEIGNNHQGNVELAFKLIDAAKDSGADILKFQHRNIDYLYIGHDQYSSFDLGSQYVYDLVTKYQLSASDLFKCFDYCASRDVEFTCTPFDMKSLSDLENYGLKFYKIASADFLNDELLNGIIKTNKPFLLSTGMANEQEIQTQISKIANRTEKFIPLHCNSTYPSPYKDLQMNFMSRLAAFGNGYVGYSGHEQGIYVPIAASIRGAKIIEKHFTLDKSLEGNDHKVSLLPNDFALMVEGINAVSDAFSDDGQTRGISQGEKANKLSLGKGLYFKSAMYKGDIIERDDLLIRSPILGLPADKMAELVGKPLMVDVSTGEPASEHLVKPSDLGELQGFENRIFIPVRQRDCLKLIDATGVTNVEFHLSYYDLQLDPKEIPWHKIDEFSVHVPELFQNDMILDLSSSDQEIWSKSVKNLQSVFEYTLRLREYSRLKGAVNLIVNVGGGSDY